MLNPLVKLSSIAHNKTWQAIATGEGFIWIVLINKQVVERSDILTILFVVFVLYQGVILDSQKN